MTISRGTILIGKIRSLNAQNPSGGLKALLDASTAVSKNMYAAAAKADCTSQASLDQSQIYRSQLEHHTFGAYLVSLLAVDGPAANAKIDWNTALKWTDVLESFKALGEWLFQPGNTGKLCDISIKIGSGAPVPVFSLN